MDNYRTLEVDLSLDDIIDAEDMDGFNNLVESTLTKMGAIGSAEFLSNITYTIIGKGEGNTVRVAVRALVIDPDAEDA